MKTLSIQLTMNGLVIPQGVTLSIPQDATDDHDNLLNAQRKVALLLGELFRRCEGVPSADRPSEPEPRRYAEVSWSVNDVLEYELPAAEDAVWPDDAPLASEFLSEEEAEAVLASVAGRIQERTCEKGWDILGPEIERAVREKRMAKAEGGE